MAHRFATPLYVFGTEPADTVSAYTGDDRLRCGFASNQFHRRQNPFGTFTALPIDPYWLLIKSGRGKTLALSCRVPTEAALPRIGAAFPLPYCSSQ